MSIRVMFLAGLDGNPFSSRLIGEHLKHVELVEFRYPMGHALNWEDLCRLVVFRMEQSETMLLAGESFGGAVAQMTYARHRDALGGLFLLSTFTFEPTPVFSMMGRTAARVLPKRVRRPVARALASWTIAGNLDEVNRRKFLDRFQSTDHLELARRLELLKRFDSRAHMQEVDIPTAIVYGAKDSIAAPATQRKVFLGRENITQHSILGVGHLAGGEAPEQVAEQLDAWALRTMETARQV